MPILSGDPPYDALTAISAASKETQDGVELTLHMEGPGRDDAIPLRVLFAPATARELCPGLQIVADVVHRDERLTEEYRPGQLGAYVAQFVREIESDHLSHTTRAHCTELSEALRRLADQDRNPGYL